jgi:DNA-binding CsgD family transcriptional regulator
MKPLPAGGATSLAAPSLEPLTSLRAASQTQFAAQPHPVGLLSNLLDDMADALLIVDRNRRIEHANAAGWEILRQGTSLCCEEGVLTPLPPIRGAFMLAIAAAFHDAGDRGAAAGQSQRYVLLGKIGSHVSIAYVRPLARMRGVTGDGRRVHALITVPARRQISTACADAFARMYRLTPTEQRVLLHLAGGATLKATALALRISGTTATTHLKHIFDKTGVRRQSDVVALFLQCLPPLLR